MKTIRYINLTNGVDVIPLLDEDYHFIRIQSTACEQKLWGKILDELDYDLLMNLALGNLCLIYDYSARKETSRALYQGLPWIEFVLNKVWFDRDTKPMVRNTDVKAYFETEYSLIKESHTVERLKYFRKFLGTDHIRLSYISSQTSHDGNYTHYREILHKYCCGAINVSDV